MIEEYRLKILIEQKKENILEKVASRNKVTFSPGVTLTLIGKYAASSKGLYIPTYDKEEDAKLAIKQWKIYLDKQEFDSEKEAFLEFKNKQLEEKRLEKVASDKEKAEDVAGRRMKITNTTCE